MTVEGGSVQPARPRDVVSVRLPAAGAYLSVLRTAAASLAARLDMTLDDIEDLRIAVDEACALLLADATPGSDLVCEFEPLDADAIRVSVTAMSASGTEPSRDTFAWTVLTALAGDVNARLDADQRLTIDLVKHRAPLEGAVSDGVERLDPPLDVP